MFTLNGVLEGLEWTSDPAKRFEWYTGKNPKIVYRQDGRLVRSAITKAEYVSLMESFAREAGLVPLQFELVHSDRH